jgi:hypothetical protein
MATDQEGVRKMKNKQKSRNICFAVLPGFSRYIFCSDARVIVTKTGKLMRTHPDQDGYPKVKLTRDDGKRVHFRLNRLIYMAFNGPIPEKMEVDHFDGDRINNDLTNLWIVTHRRNQQLKQQRDSKTLFNRQRKKRPKGGAA